MQERIKQIEQQIEQLKQEKKILEHKIMIESIEKGDFIQFAYKGKTSWGYVLDVDYDDTRTFFVNVQLINLDETYTAIPEYYILQVIKTNGVGNNEF